MCIKNIYHNTYIDGERDITERVETCRPGHVCTDPILREFDRKINCTRLQLAGSPGRADSPSASLRDRQPTPYYLDHQSTPRSGDTDRERRRERRGSQQRIYVDGDRVTDYGLRRSNSRVEPIPIPKTRRSSTMPMPVEDGYYSEPKRESRSRPIIVESSDRPRRSSSARRESATVPLGPFDVLYNYGSGSSRRDQERRTRDSYMEPTRSHRRHSRSPVEVFPQDDTHNPERRRLRRARPTIVDGPAPTNIPADALYGSSPYAGSYPSSYGSHRSEDYWTRLPTVNPQSPPMGGASKGVRWEDDPRAAQNAKISSRPKLSRSNTITGAGTGPQPNVEVKGILKNSTTATPGAPKAAETGSPPAVQPLRRDQLEDLYTSVQNLGVGERETSTQRAARLEKEEEEREEREWQERLRNRFSGRDRRASMDMPPRRFEKTSRSGRRTEVFYPDGGRYKYI
ncbi:hypothetical protein VP1G_01785 [Cytospora mali]|uniref:Uncharacterized protein n=1 Tax=Cytospora mali TaxID=578113 RepID=A0A194URN5_CYTMA|nr:hypothetical protein VP1G_01785 [Valsa mali var. pyri (nom. inval.)]